MSPEEAADPTLVHLLRRVLESPHDDTPRLVYADRCDDIGLADRGEFIRVQCEIARLCQRHRDGTATPADTARQDVLFEREAELNGVVYPSVMWPLWFWLRDRGVDPSHCVFNRGGWAAEVRLPLIEFAGGQCSCGHGLLMTYDCRRCKGVGRLPGLAADLFGCSPVTRVVLTDREPVRAPIGGGRYWRRLEDVEEQFRDGQDSGGLLPAAIFDRLAGGVANEPTVMYGGVRNRLYPSREAATDDASFAAVSFGRNAAGLPPLT